MAPPPQVTQWLKRTYPRPNVDPEWLNDCYAWVTDEYDYDPATQMDQIIRNVDMQLLESDLKDSMIPGTGLPHIPTEEKETIIRGPVLVQIISIMEIGQSAFSLMNVRQARLERADMAGLARAEDDEDEGPIPSYPRSMLRLELTDGSVSLQATEHRRLPEIKLGETRLGYKMILKDVPVRRGIAFLEPKCVVMKGHHVADLDAFQDRNFACTLRDRMGLLNDPALVEPEAAPEAPAHQPPAAAAQHTNNDVRRPNTPEPAAAEATRSTLVRSPLREVSDPPVSPVPGPSSTNHDDDAGQPRRRKLPSRSNRTPEPVPPPRPAPARLQQQSTSLRSHYFANAGPGANAGSAAQLARERLFSPHRQAPIFVPDSDEDDSEANAEWEVHGAAGSRDGGGRGPERVNGSSSDFDLGDEDYFNDEAILAHAERVEREELALEASQTHISASAASESKREMEVRAAADSSQTQRTVVATASTSRTLVGAAPGPYLSSHPRTEPAAVQITGLSGSAAQVQREARLGREETVINVDSDTDDKENIPVPTRHVRRRINRPPPSRDPGDIIELSD